MIKTIKLLSLVFVCLFSFMIFNTSKVSANNVAPACDTSSSFFSFPTWYKYLEVGDKEGDPCAIKGPTDASGDLSWGKALPRIGLAIVEILLRIVGLVTVGYIIYGGFRYTTSQGDPEGLKIANSTILNALIGMAIALLAVTLVNFLGSKLWL